MECCFFFIRKLLKKEKKCWVWLLSCQRECFPSPGGRSPVRHREPWLKQMGDWGIPQSIMSDGTSLIQSKLSSSVKTALFFWLLFVFVSLALSVVQIKKKIFYAVPVRLSANSQKVDVFTLLVFMFWFFSWDYITNSLYLWKYFSLCDSSRQ